MNINKKVSSFAGYVAIASAIVILFGGVFIYQYYAVQSLGPVKIIPVPARNAGWSTYNNFGISFQYPASFGNPQESFSGTSGGESVSFNSITSDAQPFAIYTQQDTNPQAGVVENETFGQMIARFQSNNKYIYLAKDITANGLTGKELFYNNAVTGAPYHLEADFPLSAGLYVSMSADLASVQQNIFDRIISTFKIDNSSVVKTDPATGMLIYKNSAMQFEYPQKLNSDYINLTMQTMILNPGDSKIDENGCYLGISAAGRPSAENSVVVNNVKFCLTAGSDVGAGQAYNSYYYATLKNGKYYVIEYGVHSPNACGGYENSPDVNAPGNEQYKTCMADESNWDSIVTKPVQNSISTFTFIN